MTLKTNTTFKTLLIHVFYVLALCLLTSTARAANEDIEFNRLTNRDGLSNSHINAILKDNKGYVWFGTQAGLARYDGFRVKMFLNKLTVAMVSSLTVNRRTGLKSDSASRGASTRSSSTSKRTYG